MARVLITGAGGFAGFHLVGYLKESQEIFGFDHKLRNSSAFPASITYRQIDITDKVAVKAFIRVAQPDYVFHFAALSSVADSWTHPEKTFQVNVLGQLNILTSAAALENKPRLLIACSSQEYGAVSSEEIPVKEDCPLRPDSPYAASKVCQDFLGLQYYLGFNLPVIRSRSFNHAGPGQSAKFVCSDFAKQIAEIEAGRRAPEIVVGNLDAKRDFTDVRDIVRAYWLLATKGAPGEAYNVCSGTAYSAGEILERLLMLTDVKIKINVDSTKNRPSDIPILVGDNAKIKEEIGWQPEIPFEQTLADLLDWWRGKIGERVKGNG